MLNVQLITEANWWGNYDAILSVIYISLVKFELNIDFLVGNNSHGAYEVISDMQIINVCTLISLKRLSYLAICRDGKDVYGNWYYNYSFIWLL